MLNRLSILTILFLFYCIEIKAQDAPNEAVVVIKLQTQNADGFSRSTVDTLLVRSDFILETIKEIYSNDESSISTDNFRISTRNISSGKRLKWYCLTNLHKMVGMAFDVERTPSSKTIEPYEFGQNKLKRGITFIPEPHLSGGLSLSDYSRDKDTVINGQKCFFIKRSKIIQTSFHGRKMPKVIQFRLAVNPALKSYAFPFISEKIVEHFGGGAVVYLDGKTDAGAMSEVYYSYSDFTPREKTLFNHYKELYDDNVKLLDRFEKRK